MLKLIRWKNLLIIALSMFVMHYVLIYGMIKHHTILNYNTIYHKSQVLSFDFSLQLSHFLFLILVLSVLFIAAGGYIINDILDKSLDKINRPEKVTIGKKISEKTATIYYYAFNIIGFLLSLYVSYRIHLWQLSFIFILAIGLLYFYSSSYQKIPLVGNLSVAFLILIVPLLVPIYDILALNKVYRPTLLNYHFNFNFLFTWVGGFAFFAFLATLIREIVKDAEDYEGDKILGYNTLPVIIGDMWTKILSISLLFILIAALFWINFYYLSNHLELKYIFSPEDQWWQKIRPDQLSTWYMLIMLIFPAIIVIFQLSKANTAKDYHIAGNWLKILMITGILYSFTLAYSFLNFQIIIQ